MLNRGPIKRTRKGHYSIKLSDQERDVLRDLPAELIKVLEAEDDAQATFRLFPRAYQTDLGRQVEYDRLMRDDLASRHIEALQILEQTADATELDEEQIDAWIKGLNQLRLVLGTRLDVTDETSEQDFDDESPTAGAYALYSYLGYLQDAAVEAMAEAFE